MKKTDIRKKAYNVVEMMLVRQKQIERAVTEARAEAARSRSGGGASGHVFVSDPTAQQAIKDAEPLRMVTLDDGYRIYHPEKWLWCLQSTYEECQEVERKAMHYFYYLNHSIRETAEHECMDESTAYRIRHEFRHMCTELACQLNLVNVVRIGHV